jgi:hypothetical protein
MVIEQALVPVQLRQPEGIVRAIDEGIIQMDAGEAGGVGALAVIDVEMDLGALDTGDLAHVEVKAERRVTVRIGAGLRAAADVITGDVDVAAVDIDALIGECLADRLADLEIEQVTIRRRGRRLRRCPDRGLGLILRGLQRLVVVVARIQYRIEIGRLRVRLLHRAEGQHRDRDRANPGRCAAPFLCYSFQLRGPFPRVGEKPGRAPVSGIATRSMA